MKIFQISNPYDFHTPLKCPAANGMRKKKERNANPFKQISIEASSSNANANVKSKNWIIENLLNSINQLFA